jgi:hypothetical protein
MIHFISTLRIQRALKFAVARSVPAFFGSFPNFVGG